MAKELSELVVKVGMEDAGFQSGLANLNRSMRTLKSEMSAVTATYGKFATSTSALRAKQSVLIRQLELQKVKVAELARRYEESARATGKDSKATQQYARQLNSAIAEQERIKRELDITSKALEKQTSKWGRLSTKMDKVGTKCVAVGKKISDIGKSLTALSLPLAALGTLSFRSALQLQDNMAKVSSIADTTKVSMKQLTDGVMDMSDKTGVSASALANSLYETISAGVDSADAVNFLGVATKASVAGYTDSSTAIDGLTSVLNAYGLKASEATKISDEMLIAQNLGKTTFGQMAQSIGNVIPIASSLNISTEELFASIATLTKNGIQTSESITGLKAAYSNILKPSDQAAKLAQQLGIQFNSAHLKSIGWAKFLGEVEQKTGGDAEKMATLFGSVEALNTVTVLAGKGSKDFAQALDAMGHSAGATESAYNKMLTPAQKFRIALNKLKNDGIKLANTMMPLFEKMVSGLSKVASKLGNLSEGQRKFLASAIAIGAVLAPVLIVIGKLVESIGHIGKAISKSEKAFKKLHKAFKLLKVAFLGLSTTTLIVIGVIAALGVAALVIYKNWDKIKKKTKELGQSISQTWNKIKTNTITAWNNIKTATVTKVTNMVAIIKAKWAGFKAYWSNLWQFIKGKTVQIVTSIKTSICSKFESAINGVKTIFEGLKSYFTNVWNVIKTIFLGALLLIIDLVTGNFTKLKSDAIQIWDNLKSYFSNIWTAIKEIFHGALQIISNLIKSIWNGIKNVTNSVWNSVKSFLSSVWNNIKSTAINGWNAMKSGIISIIHNTKSSIVNLWNSIVNWFSTLPSRLMAKGQAMMNGLKNGCASMYGAIRSSISSGINNALSFLSSIPSKMWNYGCNIIQGLINGIKSKISAIGNAISNVASTVSNGIRGALGIHSPSRVMMELGGYTSEGLALGIKEKANMVRKATSDVAGIVKNSTAKMSLDTKYNKTPIAKEYSSNSFDNKPLIINIDGQKVFEVLSPRMAMATRRRR